MRRTPDEILNTIADKRDMIIGFGFRRLGIFGSYARGQESEKSDIDFLVDFEKPTFDNYFDLKFFLEDLFQCEVDLVIEDVIKPRIRSHILKEVVYALGL